MIGSLEFSSISYPHQSLEKGEGLKMKLMILHAYVMNKASIKPQSMGFGELSGWLTHSYLESDASQFRGTEAPAFRTHPGLSLHTSSSSCSPVFFILSFNKLAKVSIFLSPVSHSSKLIKSDERAAKSDGSCV